MKTMVDPKSQQSRFLEQFEQFERDRVHESQALRRLRETAISRFATLGLPDSRNEDWKFTNISRVLDIPFQKRGEHSVSVRELQQVLEIPAKGRRLVFLNGEFSRALSYTPTEGWHAELMPMSEALSRRCEVVESHLGRCADGDRQVFTALNTAFATEGAFLHVPDGVVVDHPIYLFYVTTAGESSVVQPRSLLVVGAGSRVTVVEKYLGLGSQAYWTNAVTEVRLGQGGAVDHYRVQEEGAAAIHVSNLSVEQASASTFSTHLFSLGASLARNETRVRFTGEQAEATVNGLYLGGDSQHIDNHTVIDHAKPNCASHELYKGILDGKARGVFNGKIFVRQDAQKTDAKQTNQTLLLSDDATINTKPQLEIFADDVKCTHGATVGNLSADAIFYLRSRGLGLAEARSLLTFAFANDLVQRIQVEPLRSQLEERIRNPHSGTQTLPKAPNALQC
jgi:Fe-S cluster assembly protein SufD